MAHITGGGLPGNLNRALPAALDARVDMGSWTVPPLFRVLVEAGQVARDEAFRAFNMGVGMVVIAASQDAAAIIAGIRDGGINAWQLGDVIAGAGQVRL
jgi:phosphoribosylformylglycinamidine cyclo-ligase